MKEELNEVSINILKCPYKEIMERNSERKKKIPLICKNMCVPFYKAVVEDFNPKIKVLRDKYIGLGDKICNFKFKMKNEQ
ncbi:MAG: L-2-amino-thiazoline-4-carboxylic acid hydrolase [Promethearchaeota archaeon]